VEQKEADELDPKQIPLNRLGQGVMGPPGSAAWLRNPMPKVPPHPPRTRLPNNLLDNDVQRSNNHHHHHLPCMSLSFTAHACT
jgi:hypothetical protein